RLRVLGREDQAQYVGVVLAQERVHVSVRQAVTLFAGEDERGLGGGGRRRDDQAHDRQQQGRRSCPENLDCTRDGRSYRTHKRIRDSVTSVVRPERPDDGYYVSDRPWSTDAVGRDFTYVRGVRQQTRRSRG